MIGQANPGHEDAPNESDISAQDEGTGSEPDAGAVQPREYGGREGPEPTRFGDWEKNGRCIDF